MKKISKSSRQTKKIAADLAKKIIKTKSGKNAKIIALSGDLGAGKTTFVQEFLKALGVKHKITSPTFLILKPYTLNAKPYTIVYHVDCYRIHKPKDTATLGFKKILKNPKNIVIIEWAERIKNLPKNTLWIEFQHGKRESERIINI